MIYIFNFFSNVYTKFKALEIFVNKNVKAIHLTAFNKPVSGYTKNEMRDMPEQNPKISVWVGDDNLLLPIKGDGQTRVGFASGSLVKECRTIKECRD